MISLRVVGVLGTYVMLVSSLSIDDCKLSLKKFAECGQAELDQRRGAEVQESDGFLNDNITHCFFDNGCAAPAFNLSLTLNLTPDEAANWTALVSWWDTLESDKRHCVIKSLRGSFREKFHQCIVESLPGFHLGASRDDLKLSPEEKAQLKRVAEHKFRVERALDICPEPEKPKVIECLRQTRVNSVLKEACSKRKACASLLTPKCQKIFRDTYKTPICKCHKETVEILRKPTVPGPKRPRLSDSDIEEICHVDLPILDIRTIKSNKGLVLGVRAYVAAHEDRMVSICHDCGETL